jgi:hypothetical protein
MAAATMNHSHAAESRSRRIHNEFIERESRRLLIHAVKIEVRLNRKAS